MQRTLGIALLLALFSLPLFAGTNSQQFLLPSDVWIGDAQLPQGHCKVTWSQPTGSQVQLTITMDHQKTITVPAQLIEGKQADIAVQTSVANGVTYVKEFDTKNARFVIQEPAQGTK